MSEAMATNRTKGKPKLEIYYPTISAQHLQLVSAEEHLLAYLKDRQYLQPEREKSLYAAYTQEII